MKKLAVLAAALLCAATFAVGQGKDTVAVYVTGFVPIGEAQGAPNVIGGELEKALSRSKNFIAVNRTDDILNVLAKEHGYTRGGAVNDAQIKKIGNQFGVQYLCIVRINQTFRFFYVEAQLVDVESARILNKSTAGSRLESYNEQMAVAQKIAFELTGVDVAAEQKVRETTAQKQEVLPPNRNTAESMQEEQLAIAEAGGFSDVLFASKKGTVLTFAGYDKNGKLTNYSRMDVMDVTGTRDNGTVVYTMQLFDKKMRPHILTKKAIDGVVYIVDGVVGASTFIPPGSKTTDVTPLQLPSEMVLNDILPDAGVSVQSGIARGKISITDRKCTAVEKITVPAGTFECYKVEQKITITLMGKATITSSSIWYARGIGEVKWILYDHKGKLMSSSALKSISDYEAAVSQDKSDNKSGRLEKWCRFELGAALGWTSRVDTYYDYKLGDISRDTTTATGLITGLDLDIDLIYLELLGDFHISLEDGYYGIGGILAKYPIGNDGVQISPVLGLGIIGSNDAVGSPYMLGGKIDIGMGGFSYLRSEFLYCGNFEDENMMSFKIGCGLDVGIARTELRYNLVTGTSGVWKSTRHIVELRSGLGFRW